MFPFKSVVSCIVCFLSIAFLKKKKARQDFINSRRNTGQAEVWQESKKLYVKGALKTDKASLDSKKIKSYPEIS